MTSPKNIPAFLCISFLLVLLTMAAYRPVMDAKFLSYDDREYVSENGIVKQGLTLHGIGWAFTSSHSANWHQDFTHKMRVIYRK